MSSVIFVTGASGFIGRKLVPQLVKQGAEVHVLVRNPASDVGCGSDEVIIHEGDVTDIATVERALRAREGRWTALIHLAGLIAYDRASWEAMDRVNVSGTANMIQAAKQYALDARFVLLSSVVAVGSNLNKFDPPLTESAPWKGDQGLGYARTKRAAETLTLSSELHDVVVLCPSQVYGYGDATKASRRTQIKAAAGKSPIYTLGGTNLVGVSSVCDVIVRVANKHVGRSGTRYILAGENITIKELLDSFASAGGHPQGGPWLRLPTWLLSIICAIGEFLGSTTYTKERLYVSTRYHWYNPSLAITDLALDTPPARDLICDSVRYMKEHHLL